MDCGKQYVECSSCHEPLEFYDNESWRFDEHLLESKEEKDLQGGPEARLKAWICNMQFTKCRAPEPEATRATAGERMTDASISRSVKTYHYRTDD